jgi:hypothetical protein
MNFSSHHVIVALFLLAGLGITIKSYFAAGKAADKWLLANGFSRLMNQNHRSINVLARPVKVTDQALNTIGETFQITLSINSVFAGFFEEVKCQSIIKID